jgi:hygromycin-B 7''-O-kinase
MKQDGHLPKADTQAEFEAACRDESGLRRGVAAICDLHGVGPDSISRLFGGSVPVYAIGGTLVLKLCPPFEPDECETESRVLQILDGRLPIPTPRVHAVGALDGWGYILMTRLKGECLVDCWPRIPAGDRIGLAEALGETLATLHALRDPRLDRWKQDWGGFMEEQRRSCVERQRARGLEEHWLAQIPGFLDAHPLDDAPAESLLHTEIMREHLFAERDADGWKLSGLFDFEPAMLGSPEYEFAAVGLFFSCGDPAILRRVLTAYGYAEERLSVDLSGDLLAYTLLHRYSNLPWYLRRLPPPPEARTLQDLARHWWGFDERS